MPITNAREAMEYKTHYRLLLQTEKERISKMRLAPDPEKIVQGERGFNKRSPR